MGGFTPANPLNSANTANSPSAGWRPPEWSQPAMYMITVPGTSAPASPSNQTDPITGAPLPTAPALPNTMYVFDAVLRAEHVQELRKTAHPVQTGVSMVDHAYLLPPQITLEIGMSDAMDSYIPGQWSGTGSKSVNAYQTLLSLQQSRVFLTLTTRLKTYNNLLIDSVRPVETSETLHALRATVVFGGTIVASVQGSAMLGGNETAGPAVSARPQTTNSTQLAPIQAQPAPSTLVDRFRVVTPLNIPGAGFWSSNPITSGTP